MRSLSVKNKKVAILGAARSGLAAARLLQAQNARVFVSEKQSADKIQSEVEPLQATGIDFEFGGHSKKIFDSDLVILSPGISRKSEIVSRISARKIPVWGELELGFRFCPGPVIAITGSNGKSTTTALVGEMFKRGGRKYVIAGNFGYPFSAAVQQMDTETTAIVEVSSFQLETIKKFRPDIGIILNLTPDHLDRHETFGSYINTKLRLFENQTDENFAVANFEDAAIVEAIRSFNLRSREVQFHTGQRLAQGCFFENGRIHFQFGQKFFDILAVREIVLPGKHNLSNILAATAAALLTGIPVESIKTTLKNFNGLAHRLEFVRELNGVKYINDSKATNLDSMQAGLNSFQRPLIVIAGGRAKENNFPRIQKTVSEKVKKMVLIGEAADTMSAAIQNGVLTSKAGSLKDAVVEACSTAQAGEVVLLCPGCSSFDMFADFEDRGNQFKELVRNL